MLLIVTNIRKFISEDHVLKLLAVLCLQLLAIFHLCNKLFHVVGEDWVCHMVLPKFFCVLIYEVLVLEMLKGFGGIFNLWLFVACGLKETPEFSLVKSCIWSSFGIK